MQSKWLYWLPRIFALLISYITFAFLTESIINPSIIKLILSIFSSIIASSAILYYVLNTNKIELATLTPIGYWAGIFVYFILSGFDPSIDLIRFIYLSIVASVPTISSWYAWQNPLPGGGVYVVLAFLYLVAGIGRVSFLAILIVSGFLTLTGILFVLQKDSSMLKNFIEQFKQNLNQEHQSHNKDGV